MHILTSKKLTCILFSGVMILSAALPFGLSKGTSALSGSQFRAGNIISDYLFYKGNALSGTGVQNFLNKKVPRCSSGYTCLKNYAQKTPNKSSNAYCKAYKGGTYRASRIIYEVGRSCGISQKAIIVLLQKEQSLITDTSPSSWQYTYATGYGCPDSTGCSGYKGFFNQVYHAAKQYKRYKLEPQYFNYRKGRTSYVQWHPRTSCGGSKVTMQNHATAGLYNYTPYRPNKAALNNLYGTGNSCSSYGNRNFWRLYNDWFGNSLATTRILHDQTITGDWDGDGDDDIGVKRGSTYYLNYNYDGTGDLVFSYGRSSDTPIAGDWDNDGKDEIGVKRGNTYYLNYGVDGIANIVFSYGRSTDKPIAGNWDNDGIDEIGVKRGSTYYLNYNTDGTGDVVFSYGRSSDTPIAGDWDNDGIDEIGVKRDQTYFLNFENDGLSEIEFGYGRVADLPYTGDWDGDNIDEVAVRRDTTYYLNFENDGLAEIIFSYGR